MTRGRKIGLGVVALIVLTALFLLFYTMLGRGNQYAETVTTQEYLQRETLKLNKMVDTMRQSPEDTVAINRVADQLFYLERFDEAARLWEKSLSINPSQSVVWSMLGEARVKLGSGTEIPAEAIDAFNRALAIDARDDRATFYLALNEANQGNVEGAIAALKALSERSAPESITKTAAERALIELRNRPQ